MGPPLHPHWSPSLLPYGRPLHRHLPTGLRQVGWDGGGWVTAVPPSSTGSFPRRSCNHAAPGHGERGGNGLPRPLGLPPQAAVGPAAHNAPTALHQSTIFCATMATVHELHLLFAPHPVVQIWTMGMGMLKLLT